MARVLHVSAVSYAVTPSFGLRSIDLSVLAGEGLAIIGTNGAGKTTLIRLIAGLVRPDSGSVIICGLSSARWSKASRHLGYVQQSKELPDDVTVGTYLSHQLQLRRAQSGRYEDLVALAGLAEYQDVPVRRLSGGNQRKLHVLSAIAHQPDLLVLDEPTSGLDPAARDTLLQFIRTLKTGGMGVVFASHHLEELQALADNVLVLHEGRQLRNVPLAALTQAGRRTRLELHPYEPRTGRDLLWMWAAQRGTRLEFVDAAEHTDEGVRLRLRDGSPREALHRVASLAGADGVPLRSIAYYKPTLAEIVRDVVRQQSP